MNESLTNNRYSNFKNIVSITGRSKVKEMNLKIFKETIFALYSPSVFSRKNYRIIENNLIPSKIL